MGHRKLKEILYHPSCNIEYLNKEYNIINHLKKNEELVSKIRTHFSGFKDFDKSYRKIILKK